MSFSCINASRNVRPIFVRRIKLNQTATTDNITGGEKDAYI